MKRKQRIDIGELFGAVCGLGLAVITLLWFMYMIRMLWGSLLGL